MTTQRQRIITISINRYFIWFLIVLSTFETPPFSWWDGLTILIATWWLFLAQLARLELKLVDRLRKIV